MNLEEFKKIMYVLQEYYNETISPVKMKLYYENLQDMTEEDLKKVMKYIVRSERRFPTIADIRKAHIDIKSGVEDADEEWGEVLKAVRTYGYYKQDEFLESLKPKTRHVVERLGAERLLTMESQNVPMERKAFIDLYKAHKYYDDKQQITNEFRENKERIQDLTKDFLLNSQEI